MRFAWLCDCCPVGGTAASLFEVTEQKTCTCTICMYIHVVIQNWLLVQHKYMYLIHTYQLLGNIHIYTFTNATRD